MDRINADTHSSMRQIAGRHIAIPVAELCAVWTAVAERRLELLDFRVWVALREMSERRRCLSRERKPRYSLRELHGLVGGVGGASIRRSLKRLERSGLLRARRSQVMFMPSVGEPRGVEQSTTERMMDGLPKRRTFPLPRRLGRFLAAGVTRSVAATVLGEILRCVYFRRTHGWSDEGNATASWVAKTFGISERSVLRARAELEQAGILHRVEMKAWHTRRYGARYRVNLNWSARTKLETPGEVRGYPEARTGADSARCRLSAESGQDGSRLSGLDSERTPLRGSIINNKPAPSAEPRFGSSKKAGKGKPNFLRVRREDLDDTGRLLGLLEHAKTLGVVGGSEMEELSFVAAAGRATVAGSRDPCARFVWTVRNRFQGLRCADEDAARSRLRLVREPGRGEHAQQVPPAQTQHLLSEDARFVRAILGVVRSRGCVADPFPVLRRERPEWTRERWSRAMLELDPRGTARWTGEGC